MRHLAWLHATPEGSKKSRLQTFKEGDEDGDSPFLKFPDIDGAEYVVHLFQESGMLIATGMGTVPLSWQEINNWIECTQLDLSIWERLTIKEMSEVYVSELNKATAKDYAAPYVANIEPENIDRPAVADKLRSVLRGFKRDPNANA